jgi:hypothetical protein
MREKFLYLISSGHRSNEACPKCSPPDRVSEKDSSGHQSNEVCRNHRSERVEERELRRRRKGVAMEREGGRRSYAEGVETVRVRERERVLRF